jgi:hypothetical protein
MEDLDEDVTADTDEVDDAGDGEMEEFEEEPSNSDN